MRTLALFALVACRAPSTDDSCTYESLELESASQIAAWLAPDGTLVTAGSGSQPRLRAPDGTWSLDPVGSVSWVQEIDGVDVNDVWAISRDTIFHRRGGTWSAVHTAPPVQG